MNANELAEINGLTARRDRLREALDVFRKQGDIYAVLEIGEFSEVRMAANLAAENKLAEMLSEASARLERKLDEN